MYHRIAAVDRDASGMNVSPEHFRAQLETLIGAGFSIVPLHTLAESVRRGRVPPRTAVLTFDDGYLDALSTASPILDEFDAPATFFIVGRALESGYRFWWDILDEALVSNPPDKPQLRIRIGGNVVDLPTFSPVQRTATRAQLRDICFSLGPEERNHVARSIAEWSESSGAQPPGIRPMSSEEIVELAALPNLYIGAHTDNHPWLPYLTRDQQEEEILGSKTRLEQLLNHPITSFAYPYGSCDAVSTAIVRHSGFGEAVTTEPRAVSATEDLFTLPRIEATNCDGKSLLSRLNSLFER